MNVIYLIVMPILTMMAYLIGLYVGGMKEKNILEPELEKIRQERDDYKKKADALDLPMERFVIKEERRNLVPIKVREAFDLEEYERRTLMCCDRFLSRLERKVMREFPYLFEYELRQDPDLHQMVITARASILPAEKNNDLRILAEEERRENEQKKHDGRELDLLICEGNPGALSFMMSAYEIDMLWADMAFARMRDAGITGTKLYMLWNDCCDRDTRKALAAMKDLPIYMIQQYINYENGRGIHLPDDVFAICYEGENA